MMERKRNALFNNTLNTFYLRLYCVGSHDGSKILQHLTLEINHRKWGVELLISDITGSIFDYTVPH